MNQNGYSITTATTIIPPSRSRRRHGSGRRISDMAWGGWTRTGTVWVTGVSAQSSERNSFSCASPTAVMITNRNTPSRAPVPNSPLAKAVWYTKNSKVVVP
jgi:hypothetical protein